MYSGFLGIAPSPEMSEKGVFSRLKCPKFLKPLDKD